MTNIKNLVDIKDKLVARGISSGHGDVVKIGEIVDIVDLLDRTPKKKASK